jgi:hypothetical protein
MVAAAVIGAGVLGAAGSAYASSQASDAQQSAANTASGTQLQMYNQSRQDQTPWRQAGGQAVNALSNWYGLGGVQQQQTSGMGQPSRFGGGAGGMNGIYGGSNMIPGGSQAGPSAMSQEQTIRNTPGYQFNFDQGQQAVQRNLAAKGLLNSGAAGKALTQYGQGYADNYQQQYVSGLQSLAGLGQSSANSTGALGANAANQIGSNQIYGGNAAAAGYANQSNSFNQGLGSIVQGLGRYGQSSYYGSGTGSQYLMDG